jgi:hypothetical protein
MAMEKVRLIIGVKVHGTDSDIELIEAVADDPGTSRLALLKSHKGAGYDYLAVVEAWRVAQQDAEPKVD